MVRRVVSTVLIGYARVSTADQNPDHQIDALVRAGVEAATSTSMSHPGPRCRARKGDTLKVTRLDRLGRSVHHLVNLGAELKDRGVGLNVLEQGIDTTTPEGRAMFGMLSVLAEYQRELIVANTRDGRARPAALRHPYQDGPADRRHVRRRPHHRVRPPHQERLLAAYGVMDSLSG